MTVKSSAFFLPEMAVRIELVFNNRPIKTTWTGGISTNHGGDKMTRKRRSKKWDILAGHFTCLFQATIMFRPC